MVRKISAAIPSMNTLAIIAAIVALNNVAKYFSDDPIVGYVMDCAAAPMRLVTCGPSYVAHSAMDLFFPIETLLARASLLPWDIACLIARGNPPGDASLEANFTRLSIRWMWLAATCDTKPDGGKNCFGQFALALGDNKIF